MNRIRLPRHHLLTLVALLVLGSFMFTAPPARAASRVDRLEYIKSRANLEIDRRLERLRKLDSAISGATRLTETNKSTLTTEVNSEIAGLTRLQQQIDSDTDTDTARIDAQAIFNDYRVYALILPKVWLVRVADDQQVVESKSNILSGKLQTRINQAQNKGRDVTAMQVSLNDMIAKTVAAQKLSSMVEEKVLPLQPTDYNNDHTILSGYRDQLKTAHANNKAAFADAKSIVQNLAGM